MAFLTRRSKPPTEELDDLTKKAQERAFRMERPTLLAYINTTLYAFGRALSDYESAPSLEQQQIDLHEADAQERVLRVLLNELMLRSGA